jgi:hypothetical protein
VSSFKTCATAADRIVELLRAYDKAFSVQKAPYLVSYATYVAATIHARIAAKRGADSSAYTNLTACLSVFRDNQKTNWAVRRANAVIQNLMKRLGLSVPDVGSTELERPANTSSRTDLLGNQSSDQDQSIQTPDIDGILESFIREQENAQSSQTVPHGRVASTDMTAAAPPPGYGPFPGPSAAYTDDREMVLEQDHPYGTMHPYPQLSDASVTVDDLLYGLNGSALDSFAFLDWESI